MLQLPELKGAAIEISMRPKLTTHDGKLLSGSLSGKAVHAACFVRKREIVLETALGRNAAMLRLIVIHEIFHFVWARLGNALRQSFAAVLRTEAERGARGELGESAAIHKDKARSKEYLCESFCDTAAWMYAGVEEHAEFTLARRWRNKRRAWFEYCFERPRAC